MRARFTYPPQGAPRPMVALEVEGRFLAAPPDSIPTHTVKRLEVHPWGVRVIVGDERVPQGRVVARFSNSALYGVRLALLNAMLPLREADATRVTCVAIRIPEKKESKHRDPEPSRRPLGYLDPASVSIEGVSPWDENTAMTRISSSTGGGGNLYRCLAVRPNSRSVVWTATCMMTGSWAS